MPAHFGSPGFLRQWSERVTRKAQNDLSWAATCARYDGPTVTFCDGRAGPGLLPGAVGAGRSRSRRLGGPLPVPAAAGPRPAPVPAQYRRWRPGHVAGRRLARAASSASMALMCARMGPRTGEPGNARVRLTVRWRRARSSSSSVIPLTSWGRFSGTGHPRAGRVVRCDRTAHAGRLGGVDHSSQFLVCEHGCRVAEVRRDRGHPVAGGQQRPCVCQDHRVVVDVRDLRCGQDRPRGLVDGRGSWQPGAQVEELADPLAGGPGDGSGDERPVLPYLSSPASSPACRTNCRAIAAQKASGSSISAYHGGPNQGQSTWHHHGVSS